MHLSFLHKYVIISITYLTPKPAKVCLGSHSLRLCIREDGGGHRPKTLPPTPFPNDASNQPTFTPYMKITACYGIENGPLQPIKVIFVTDFGEAINKRSDKNLQVGHSAPKNWRIIGCISMACSFWICS